MKKRIFAVALAALLLVSTFAGSMITASAADVAPPNPNRLPTYTPSTGVETFRLHFALPGAWIGEEGSDARKTWEKYGSTSGLYWWGSLDNPDEAPAAASHGWPGWKMETGASIGLLGADNLYTTLVPKNTASMIFDNFIDGGMDESYPEYKAAKQTKDLTQLEYLGQGDSDYFSKEFWDYIYDNYYDDFVENPNYQIEEFGPYAKNFFYSEEDDSIYHYLDDMVFVVDTVNTDRAQVSPVSGMAGLDGGFYFYYGGGEFGIWPTKELCIKQEELKTTTEGGTEVDIANETKQEKTDFVTRERTDAYDLTTKKDVVVFGNFTGKYWKDTSEIVVPTDPASDPTTAPATQNATDGDGSIPDPDNNDAGSSSGSTSDEGTGSNDSNGAIATGQFAGPVLLCTVLIAGLGVFYFVRKRRSSK